MKTPMRLYKYQAYSSFALEALIQKKIWVSNPTDFNDPFDCRVRPPTIESRDEVLQLNDALNRLKNPLYNPTGDDRPSLTLGHTYGEEYWEQPPEMLRTLLRGHGQQLVDWITKLGVYSLTSSPNNLLMWAHYAAKHQGFVIGFDTSTLQLPESASLIPVQYLGDYSEIDLETLTDVTDGAEYLKNIAMRKGSQWSHENEWRLVYPEGGYLANIPMQPVEVIFGHKMAQTHRHTLHSLICKQFTGVQFSILKPSSTAFGLEPEPYTG